MAQGRSSEIISMITWIRTSRLSMKNSLSERGCTSPLQMLSEKSLRVTSRSAICVGAQALFENAPTLFEIAPNLFEIAVGAQESRVETCF